MKKTGVNCLSILFFKVDFNRQLIKLEILYRISQKYDTIDDTVIIIHIYRNFLLTSLCDDDALKYIIQKPGLVHDSS